MEGKKNFGDKKIKKSLIPKKLFKIGDIDVDKILISKIKLYDTKNSFKYFIGYDDNDAISPMCIEIPQMIGYVNLFSNAKTMSFKVNDKRLLKYYIKI